LLMERKLQRGIEAQESSSGNNGKKKRLGSGKSSQGALSGIINKISAIFRRKN
jgi:hypothetical protein